MSFFYGNNLTGGYSMSDLSLFNSNQSKEVVTTRELAEILRVDVRTVQLTVQHLGFAKVLSQSTGGRPTQVFNQEQVTLIKQEIQKHHNLMTTKDIAKALNISDRWVRNTIEKLRNNNSAVFEDICLNSQGGFLLNETQVTAIKLELQNHSKVNALSPKTLLEKQLLIQQAMQLQSEMIEELQAENERQKAQLTEQAPKVATYNRIANATGLKSMQEVAKILHIGSKTLFAILRDKKIFYREKSNGVNIPVEKYIKQGLFEVKEEPYRKDGKDCVYTRIFCNRQRLAMARKNYTGFRGIE